jgi:hypothetical protein
MVMAFFPFKAAVRAAPDAFLFRRAPADREDEDVMICR